MTLKRKPIADKRGLPDRTLLRIAQDNGVVDADLVRMDRFVRHIVVDGKSTPAAARLVGWGLEHARTMAKSPAYEEMRAELLSRFERSVEQTHTEIFNVVAETAVQGAVRQHEIVRTSKNETLVNNIAIDAMNRIGAKAPDRQEVKHEVELTDASAALIAKALGELAKVKAIDLERDYGFALKRPEMDEDRAIRSVGTAHEQPAQPTDDFEQRRSEGK